MNAASEVPESHAYVVRRQKGFVRSTFVVADASGEEWGRFARPLRPVRGCLALLVAPAVFLGMIVLGVWLAGGLEDDELRHHASRDPHPLIAIPAGILYAALTLASPMVVTQWIYPANCLRLRAFHAPRQLLLEVRDRMAITVHSVVYSIRGPTGEVLASVRHDLVTTRYEVRNSEGQPIFYLANEKAGSTGTQYAVWLVVETVIAVLLAVLFRSGHVPGLPEGDKGTYWIWRAEDFHDAEVAPIGEAVFDAEPQPQVRIRLEHGEAPSLDPRITLGLATVILVS